MPADVCDALGVDVGDAIDMEVTDGALVMKPARVRALDALEAIRRAFAESGVTLPELLQEGERQRQKTLREFDARQKATKSIRR